MASWGGTIRPVAEADRPWMADVLTRAWSAPIVVSRGHVYRPAELDGFIADPSDGEERLFGWYNNGDVTVPTADRR